MSVQLNSNVNPEKFIDDIGQHAPNTVLDPEGHFPTHFGESYTRFVMATSIMSVLLGMRANAVRRKWKRQELIDHSYKWDSWLGSTIAPKD